MGYIGKDPADSFISFVKQDFSVSATTSYTLDNAVTNQNEIALFINHVRQEPTTAYTASGTSLTLTSATASGDDMYCVYLGIAKQTVNPPDGSVGSSQVASTIITGQTAETSIATDDTILIHDTSASALRKMTRANFVSGVGGTNTPTFLARKSGDQAGVVSNTYTKVTGWAEIFDPQSTWDNSNSKWSPASAGKYFIFGTVYIYCNDATRVFVAIYKNGSLLNQIGVASGKSDNFPLIVTAMDDNDGDDYYELYAKTQAAGTVIYSVGVSNQFGGYKLIT